MAMLMALMTTEKQIYVSKCILLHFYAGLPDCIKAQQTTTCHKIWWYAKTL